MQTIGLVVANPVGTVETDQFFSEIAQGVARAAQEHGYHLLLETTHGLADEPLPRMVRDDQVMALVVGGIPITDEYVYRLRRLAIPVVFIGRYTATHYQQYAVLPDNFRGGYLAGSHLVQHGYEDVWYLSGRLDICTYADRLSGLRQALRERGVSLPDDRVLTDDFDESAGWRMAGRLLERGAVVAGRRLGVVAATDWIAAGALRRLTQAGWSVPGQVGVLGYNDSPLAAHVSPTLTTVRARAADLAYGAVRLVSELLAGKFPEPVQLVVQPALVVRESTAPSTGVSPSHAARCPAESAGHSVE